MAAAALRVALHDAVGHQLESAPALGRELELARPPPWPRPRGRAPAPAPAPALPVATIRSQICLRRRRAQTPIQPAQLGSHAPGEDQRQRDRAVQQVGAAGLAGALGRSRHVEHVVEQLEGQPDLLAEAPERDRPAQGDRRTARPAGRTPRTGSPSSAGSARGSAPGSRPSRQASARCISSPRASADEALGQRADRIRARRSRPARRRRARRAGRRWPWPPARPPSAKTVGRPRRRDARSSTSSCTSVAMCSSSTAAAAETSRPSPSFAQRKTSIGRSRLPPANSVPVGVPGQLGAVTSGHLGQPLLGALEQARELRSARGQHRAELGLRSCSRAHGPAVDGDDPAGGQDPAHLVQSRRRQPRRQLRGLWESGERSRAGRCRRRSRRPRGRAAGTARSNQSEKNHDSGGRSGVVISRITTRPPGLATRAISRDARGRGRRSCGRRSRP